MKLERKQILKRLLPAGHFIVARSTADYSLFIKEHDYTQGWQLMLPVHLVEYREDGKGQDIIKTRVVPTELFDSLLFFRLIEAVLMEKLFDDRYYFRFGLTKAARMEVEKL